MIEDIWYGTRPGPAAARVLLSPLALLFGAGVALRSSLYDRGLLETVDVGVPVISVGGLTVGGAGKTPFVIWLASRLVDLGLRPCVLTRGYGGSAKSPLLVRVPDPSSASTSARGVSVEGLVEAAGDEAVLIALRTGVPVVVAGDRVAGARLAIDQVAPDLLLMDDGFQHRRLARALDIVLLGGGESRLRLLPAGPLRETEAALARAAVVVRTGSPGPNPKGPLRGARLELSMRLRPTGLARVGGEPSAEAPTASATALAGLRVGAVAAIAGPQRFVATLQEAGASVAGSLFLRDHHAYDAADWSRIRALAQGCDLVVTTEKDAVKLARFAAGADWLRVLTVDAEVAGQEALIECIGRIVGDAGFDRKRGATHHPPSFGGPASQ